MDFTIDFLARLGPLLLEGAPLFAGLSVIISVLSLLVGRKEGWSAADSLYFGFITALTVGYGDLRPASARGKWLAIFIALIGMITTGVMIAVAVQAASLAYASRHVAGG